ncbi:MAG: TetR/AcrR family transcriptional regulator [Lachnospiraceae bacterium]|nr:TetR/AcrR family transcriptional regulator [Lachnospiraceae bacterium]
MNVKNNQRYHDTEIRMEAAMLKLMKHTEPEKITVRKICEQAQVNRSTFYAHFIDIFDMLDKMEAELGKELMERYTPGNQAFSEESFLPFLLHIRKHCYFYKVALNNRRSFPIQNGYEKLLSVIRPFCHRAGITDEEEIICCLTGFQAGFTMILKRWVDNDCLMDENRLAAILLQSLPSVLTQDPA